MEAQRITIKRSEETACAWCGYSLLVGDVAYVTDHGVYCCTDHAQRHADKRALKAQADAAFKRQGPPPKRGREQA